MLSRNSKEPGGSFGYSYISLRVAACRSTRFLSDWERDEIAPSALSALLRTSFFVNVVSRTCLSFNLLRSSGDMSLALIGIVGSPPFFVMN